MSFYTLIASPFRRGGPGSGNFGHKGVPGQRGGSAPRAAGGVAAKPSREEIMAQIRAEREARENFPFPERLKPLARQIDVQDADTDIVKRHIEHLSRFSEKTIRALVDKGVSFYLGNKPITRLNHNQKLRGKRPRGWPKGATWDKVAGGYNPQARIITAGSAGGSDEGVISLIGHEVGHALAITGILGKKTLTKIANIRKGNIRKLNPYFRQRQGAGLEEFMAEAVALAIVPDYAGPGVIEGREIFDRAVAVLREDGIV
jgi:hypothetical protein